VYKKRQDQVDGLQRARVGSRIADRLPDTVKSLRNKKQLQRRLLLNDKVVRYNKEQPVRDSKRQLLGKVIDNDVQDALERSENITAEHFRLVDAIIALPETI
jgi:hypothetical protein